MYSNEVLLARMSMAYNNIEGYLPYDTRYGPYVVYTLVFINTEPFPQGISPEYRDALATAFGL